MKIIVCATVFLAVTTALPIDKSLEIVDNDIDLYYLVPLRELSPRVRRETTWNIGSPGVTGSIQHKGTILDNQNHRLDGNIHASKDFAHSGPVNAGGNLDYLHKPSGSGLSVGADRGIRGGTDLSASGKWNIYENKNGYIGLRGQYDKTIGGRGGKPNYGGYLEGGFKF